MGHLGAEVGSERLQSQPLEGRRLLVALGRLRRLVLAPPLEPFLQHRQLVALVQTRAELPPPLVPWVGEHSHSRCLRLALR